MLRWSRLPHRWAALTCVVAIAVVTSVSSAAAPPTPIRSGVLSPAQASAAAAKPNIVMVLADDLETRIDLRKYPNIARLMAEGVSFSNMIVSDSWCCPSRASILRSQYVHSHKVISNRGRGGGWQEFVKRGHERSTMGTWLQDAGYRTSMIGKYLNHYPKPGFGKPKDKRRTHVPPGWDDWNVVDNTGYPGFGYRMHGNGKVKRYGHKEKDYLTDVMARKAASFIGDTPKRKPLFLYAAPFTPHLPATPAPRHKNAFKGAKAPRVPSYMKMNFRKEPGWMQRLPVMKEWQLKKMDRKYRKRLQSMLSIDDMVGTIREKLEREGRLDNTYFVFTSDNGFKNGEHGMPMGKTTPFEEDVRVPMIVRGPGIAAGTTINQPVSTVDLGVTFTDLGQANAPKFAEGRSFAPLLAGREPDEWRTASLVEFYAGESTKAAGPDCDSRVLLVPGCPFPQSYAMIRTERYTYVEYVTGERQLYDRERDPHQFNNIVAVADKALVADLSTRLRRMHACNASGCLAAEVG